MADLITNRPGGVMTLHGLAALEDGALRLRVRIEEDGAAHDWTGWTVDYAQITTPDLRTQIAALTVAFEADGWFTVEGTLAATTALARIYPHGMPARVTVRVKDSAGKSIYLIAPSDITITNGPGATT